MSANYIVITRTGGTPYVCYDADDTPCQQQQGDNDRKGLEDFIRQDQNDLVCVGIQQPVFLSREKQVMKPNKKTVKVRNSRSTSSK